MKMVEMGKNYNFSLNYKSDFLRLGSNIWVQNHHRDAILKSFQLFEALHQFWVENPCIEAGL